MLVAVVLVLNVIGLVMVMSASSVMALQVYGSSWVFFERQLLWMALGVAAFFTIARVDYRALRRIAPGLLVVSVVLLVLVFVPGIGSSALGSARWLGRGPVKLQPSELVKLGLLVYVAEVLTRRAAAVDDWHQVLRPILLVFGLVAMLVMKQPDMGTTIVLAVILSALLYAGGVSVRHLLPVAGAGLLAAVALAFAAPYRRARLLAFLHPFADRGNTGYQAVQSLIALGTGGVGGVGLGASRSKWLFLPHAHTDFIFSVIGEELGLIGSLLVVALFATLAVLGVRVALRAPDRFGYLLALGITVWIVGQGLINIGAAIGLLPITGVPLPYVSFGGSALVFTMTASGILLNVARQGR